MTEDTGKASAAVTSNKSSDGTVEAGTVTVAVQKQTLVTVLVTSVCVGAINSVLLGLGEFVFAWISSTASKDSSSWPWDIVLAVAGQTVTTHLLLWIPVMASCGMLYWLVTGRRGGAAEPFLFMLQIVLVAVLIVPADLMLAKITNPVFIVIAVIAGLAVAGGTYFLLRILQRRWSVRGLQRIVYLAAVVPAVIVLVLGVLFIRSPWFNPVDYRVAEPGTSSTRAGRPNVLWLVLDTVRADHMSVYGYEAPTTPFLEKLAQQCLVFERAVANGNWTLPCHASMFTGLPVRSHGFGLPAGKLDSAFQTVAEVLRDNGYITGLFSNNELVAPKTALARGFQTAQVIAHIRGAQNCSLSSLLERYGITPPVPWLDPDYGAALTQELIKRWLNVHQDEPFFLFVNYMETHLPFRVPRRYREMFMSPEQMHRSYDMYRLVYGNIGTWLHIGALVDGYDHMPQFDRDVIKRQYESALCYLDDQVREMIDDISRRGLLDNTLVVITSDHGEYLDTHQMWSHHFQLYQDVIHVPMLIREPGRRDARRVNTLVQLSDLYPTVLRYVLGPEAAETSAYAQDLFEVAELDQDDRIVISEAYPCEPTTMERLLAKNDPLLRHRASPQIAAVGSRFKYIDSSDGMRELFDLDNDTGELDNLVYSHRQEGQRLANYLKWWLKTTPAHKPSQEAESIYSAEVIDALKALGYIGDDP